MANNELLTRHKGTRNVYLWSISNSEREALDIMSNFQMTDGNHITKLLFIKNSANDKLRKVRELDETILSILEQADAEQELETVLSRDDRKQELIVKIERCMNKVPKESIETSSVMSSSSPSLLSHNPEIKVKLPKLQISKFDGDIINFRGFWDQFNSAIHSNDSINDIDKFCYSKFFLCDSAESCISGLSLSSANYFEAIELLKQRYGNPQMLINAYMKRFVELPVIKNKNGVFGLRKLYDQVESSIRNLKSLQMDNSGYGTLLVPLLTEKLPFNLRQSIAKKFENDNCELPQMLKILKVDKNLKNLRG